MKPVALNALLRHFAATTIILLVANIAFAASKEKTIYSFKGITGSNSSTGLTFDAQGNLYGSTATGGFGCPGSGCGVIFKLTPLPKGQWAYHILYGFRGFDDGAGPNALILDGEGNLYGVASSQGPIGCGTVFKLTHNADDSWSFGTIYEFGFPPDGCQPVGRLVFDTNGNLYGTTFAGGSEGNGTLYELTQTADGTWASTILYSFQAVTSDDGANPVAGPVLGADGNIYGTTTGGGSFGSGTVFELLPSLDGWSESVIHNFQLSGGYSPGILTVDPKGNLYGVALHSGGDQNCGMVFELANGNTSRTYSVLHKFSQLDGCGVIGDMAQDSNGNLFGTTAHGGIANNGLVFELVPGSGGTWTENRLYSFTGAEGAFPESGVMLDKAGNLYGTTSTGGAYGFGSVFEIK